MQPVRWLQKCMWKVGKMHKEGKEIIMIGHQGHPEVEGTMGQAEG